MVCIIPNSNSKNNKRSCSTNDTRHLTTKPPTQQQLPRLSLNFTKCFTSVTPATSHPSKNKLPSSQEHTSPTNTALPPLQSFIPLESTPPTQLYTSNEITPVIPSKSQYSVDTTLYDRTQYIGLELFFVFDMSI